MTTAARMPLAVQRDCAPMPRTRVLPGPACYGTVARLAMEYRPGITWNPGPACCGICRVTLKEPCSHRRSRRRTSQRASLPLLAVGRTGLFLRHPHPERTGHTHSDPVLLTIKVSNLLDRLSVRQALTVRRAVANEVRRAISYVVSGQKENEPKRHGCHDLTLTVTYWPLRVPRAPLAAASFWHTKAPFLVRAYHRSPL